MSTIKQLAQIESGIMFSTVFLNSFGKRNTK